MKLTAKFIKRDTEQFDTVELYFSVFHFISGNPRWYCRVWKKDWVHNLNKKYVGESYGKNKFEAYRMALESLK